MNNLFKDEYSRKARLFPCVVVAIPYAIIIAAIIYSHALEGLVAYVKVLISVFAGIGLGITGIVYWLAERIRNEGRKLQARYFGDGVDLPTTRMALWSDTSFTDERKDKIHSLLNDVYGLRTLSREGERENEWLARKLIAEAVDVVRPLVNDGIRLLQYNIRFGCARNLAAGSKYAVLGSLIGLIVGAVWLTSPAVCILELVAGVYFVIKMFATGKDMRWFGNEYAKVFWSEFIEISMERGLQSGRSAHGDVSKG